MAARRQKRNPLDGVSPEQAIQARCGACRKVVLVGEFRDEVLAPVVDHYMRHHPEMVSHGLMLEGPGGHFQIEPAPLARCDLCGLPAERPWWVWVTPRTEDYEVQDEEWLVCDGCHVFAAKHEVIGLCRRVFVAGSEEFVVDDPVRRKDDIRHVVTQFLSHADTTLTVRETA